MRNELIEAIKGIETYMDVDVNGDQVIFETRENGDVGEEEYSHEDLKEAYKVVDEIKKIDSWALSPYVDTSDEWVMVIVNV